MTLSSSGAVALVGPGRAGTALALGLQRQGWCIAAVAGRAAHRPSTLAAAARFGARADTVAGAVAAVDLVVVAVPDAAIAATASEVAAASDLAPGTLVIHLAGSLGVGALRAISKRRPDVRVGALHPLQTLPSADAGADRLAGSWCAIAGDAAVTDLAIGLGCLPFVVADADRARYHAAACVAGNHLVALLGQVERLAQSAGVPAEAFVPLVRAAVENVAAHGAATALTGPIARGDAATVARHLNAISPAEQPAYRALAAEALRLTGRNDPAVSALLEPGAVTA